MNKQGAKNQWYLQLVDRLTPKSAFTQSLLRSFWVGGAICFLGQCLLSSRTDGLFCHERAAGDQVHDKKGNRGHNEDAEDAHCDTLDDVLCHRLMPLHSYQ